MKKLKILIGLLMIKDKNKSHYIILSKTLTDLCALRQKIRIKKTFSSFSSERVLVEHKETCLGINVKQIVKLRNGSNKLKNHFKQLAVPFKIYAGFESLLKRYGGSDRNNNTSYTEKYQKHIPCSFAYKVICVDDKFSKAIFLYRGKMQISGLLKQFLKGMIIAKKMTKRLFNKNLVMFEKDEQRFH